MDAIGNTGSFGRAAVADGARFVSCQVGRLYPAQQRPPHVWEQSRDMAQELRYTDDGRFLPLR